MHTRNESLDALRGFAILAMVLSGSIAFGDTMPGWMYHAQVPPPLHQFNPGLPGITWVDLVFPFFLFSMGAAMPLSLQKYLVAKSSFGTVAWVAFKRFLLLAFFALFTEHFKAWNLADAPATKEHLLSLLAFVLLFFQFYERKNQQYKSAYMALRILAFAGSVFLLWVLPFQGGAGFRFYKSDIIIIVLANMAFFGTLIYYATANRPLVRLGILPFVMAIFLAAKEPGMGWSKAIFNFSHIGSFQFDWLYKFYFLKYLFVVIPGTMAGEWIMGASKNDKPPTENKAVKNWLAIIAAVLVCLNVYCLYQRLLLINVVSTVVLCGVAIYLIKKPEATSRLIKNMVKAGCYLLLLGLFFEAFEGGIKKDPSTYSYYFVTSGLAFLMLVSFTVFVRLKYVGSFVRYFSLNGKNPMVAYVAGSLLLLPLMTLTHTKPLWDSLQQNAWMGFLKGATFTAIVSGVTILFVKRKWFWKT